MKHALIVVDLQKDFVDGALGTPEAQSMLPRLVEKLKSTSKDLFFTQDTHFEDYLSTQEGKFLPVKHCIKNSEGWKIVPELEKFIHGAIVIEKPTFGSLDLPKLLEGYDSIELVGLCTDICVISNAMILKAAFPEIPISIDPNCCAGITPESHNRALESMKTCQIQIEGDV
ncbi:MAG: cysteine hydrolase [Selenomonadaceae bacterium]|nr:cysteine hydrolase [Selenomonadaceae bacterium]